MLRDHTALRQVMMFLSARGLNRGQTVAILTQMEPDLEKQGEMLYMWWNHLRKATPDNPSRSNIWKFLNEQADQEVDLNEVDPQALKTWFTNDPRYNGVEHQLQTFKAHLDEFVKCEALRTWNTRSEPIIGFSQMESTALRSINDSTRLECEAADLLTAELCRPNREYISVANMQILMAGTSQRDNADVVQYAYDHVFTKSNATSWASVINPYHNH